MTAADGAQILSKVLNVSYETGLEKRGLPYLSVVDVNDDGVLSANDAAYVIKKVTEGEFMLPCENRQYIEYDSLTLSRANGAYDCFTKDFDLNGGRAYAVKSYEELKELCREYEAIDEAAFTEILENRFGKGMFDDNMLLIGLCGSSTSSMEYRIKGVYLGNSLSVYMEAVAPNAFTALEDSVINVVSVSKNIEYDNYFWRVASYDTAYDVSSNSYKEVFKSEAVWR